MKRQKTWITFNQIDTYLEETTSIWLKKGLNEAGRDVAALKNYVAYVCAVWIIYETFRPDKCLQVVYYHEEMFEAFNQDDWSLEMLRFLPHLQRTFLPHEWAIVWRRYYRKMRRRMLKKQMPTVAQQLQALDHLTLKAMEAGIGEKILREMAADPSLAFAPG